MAGDKRHTICDCGPGPEGVPQGAVFGKPVPNLTKHQSSRLLSPYRSPDERRRFAAIKVTKTYQPENIERQWYENWESKGYFRPRSEKAEGGEGDSYSIAIPPPNVTGSLHMGHAFQHTIMDTLTRFKRMQGRNALWTVGTDHAGIATQMVVERKLAAEEGKTRHDLTITRQMRRLGNSVDWSNERFTMDDGFYKAVQEVFIRLYDEGLVYRGKRLVNWDPKLHTAISDLEVENKEEKGYFWHLRYPLADGQKTQDGKDYVIVATTRPETMLGDTAVAVHPDDERYQHLIGQHVLLLRLREDHPRSRLQRLRRRQTQQPAHDQRHDAGRQHS